MIHRQISALDTIHDATYSTLHSKFLNALDCTLPSTLSSMHPSTLDCTLPSTLNCTLNCTLPSTSPSTLSYTLLSTLLSTLPRSALECRLSSTLGCRDLQAPGGVWQPGMVGGRNHDFSRFHGLNLIFGAPTATGSHDISRSWCW